MTKRDKTEISRLIATMENSYPSDDLITTYADFLKFGPFLRYYQYNPFVLEKLSTLTIQLWTTPKRIARLDLLITIKHYVSVAKGKNGIIHIKNSPTPKDTFTDLTYENLFSLFKLVHSGKRYLTEKQNERGKEVSNYFLKDIFLPNDAIQWLCDHSLSSPYILNRVLRYHTASHEITSWARQNITSNELRSRRAELTSWIIDEDIDFEINEVTLIADFEYQNKVDKKNFRDYVEEIHFNQHLADELRDLFPVKKSTINSYDNLYRNPEILEGFTEPVYVLSKRFYKVPLIPVDEYDIEVPDFELLKKTFYKNIQLTKAITMIWSIGYSRLDTEIKSQLLKKYFNNKTIPSLLKVANKFRLVPLLKWMATQ